MPYGVRVHYNSVDISNKVRAFSITKALDQFCREINITVADIDFSDQIDWSVLPEAPLLEVWTRTENDWVSQGKFHIEKPSVNTNLMSVESSFWGRSLTARLSTPFAPKVSKVWDTDTTFFSICDEMCALCGITWDSNYSDIGDFVIYAGSYEADKSDPIEVLTDLLELVYEKGAFFTTDNDGHLCIRERQISPTTATVTITDPIAVGYSEDPEFPEFGNRKKITCTGSSSSISIKIISENTCLSNVGMTKLMARVSDQDGNGIQNLPVSWESTEGLVALLTNDSSTQTVTIANEAKQATSFYTVELEFPPSSVVSVYKAKDTNRTTNLLDGGYSISGNIITFSTALDYCDQSLVITYETEGVAINYATAGTSPGTDKIVVSIDGNSDTVDLNVENPCKCPPQVQLKAFPSSIKIGSIADLLVYAEVGGYPIADGRTVYMTLASTPSHGTLGWTQGQLGNIDVENEVVDVSNEIRGISQCTLPYWPVSVVGAWVATFDADGNPSASGDDIYGSNSGKVITLLTELETGTQILVNYRTVGAVLNTFKGVKEGTDKLKAFVITTREAPAEAFCTVSVSKDPDAEPSPDPEGCCDDGLCEQEGSSCDPDPSHCEDGKVYCKRGGVDGCYTQAECDTTDCPEGQVNCQKDGTPGCYPSNECDNTYIEGGGGNRYGMKSGQLGCWPVSELDRCGTDPVTGEERVTCYKDGKLNCVAADDCDTTYGKTGAVECGAMEQCCTHKVTGKQGCYQSGDCRADGGGGGDTKPPKLDPSGGESCTGENGSTTKCKKGEKCCISAKTGKKGCTPELECEDSGWGCSTKDCQADPSENCLQQRFSLSLSLECTCDEICKQEFDRFGTTQGYRGSDMKPIADIVVEEGLTEGTEEYNARTEELTEEAMGDCLEKCGGCADYGTTLTISGSDAVTAPGSYQYDVEGGMPPHTWEVSGTGVAVDAGMVTLDAGACGTFTVTVTDKCGTSAEFKARVTNRGQWYFTEKADITRFGGGTCGYYAYTCSAWGNAWYEGVLKYTDCYGNLAITGCISNGWDIDSWMASEGCKHPWFDPKETNDFTDCYICPGCHKKTYCFLACVNKWEWGC